ncbi:MAG: restriction endonuclease subunit S [Bacteroidota bacterium]
MKNELPYNWQLVKLSEVSEIIMGQSPPSSDYNRDRIGLPFFQGKAEFTDLHPVPEKWCSIPKKIAEPNDILLCVRAPVGITNIANEKCCIGRGLAAIRYNPNYKYIFYFLRSVERQLDNLGTGTTFKAISGKTIREFDIPFPPLSEQKLIVSKIEELFSELDAGVTQLKKAQQQLKTYRQAVLKWAFEGRLTNRKVNGELPKGWKSLKFGELFSESPQNGLYKSSNEYGSGTPIIRIDGFYEGVILEDYQYKRVRLTDDEIDRYIISEGDILVNRVNSMPYLGKCGIVKHLKEKTVFESNIMKVKLNKKVALPEYFTMYLSSKKGVSELRKNAKQAVNQASINQTDVSDAIVPVCPIETQHRIVYEIKNRLGVADKMEKEIEQTLLQAELLRQSILKCAFEGKLV